MSFFLLIDSKCLLMVYINAIYICINISIYKYFWCAVVHTMDMTEWLNWTELIFVYSQYLAKLITLIILYSNFSETPCKQLSHFLYVKIDMMMIIFKSWKCCFSFQQQQENDIKGCDFPPLTMHQTSHTHHCILKAGFKPCPPYGRRDRPRGARGHLRPHD